MRYAFYKQLQDKLIIIFNFKSNFNSSNRRSLWTRSKTRAGQFPMNLASSNLSSDSSEDKRDHLTITSNQQRDNAIHDVTVTEISDISPTVKKIVLDTAIKPVPISFKAGQWLDMFIPNEKTVGGFSMVSSPTYLTNTGLLELAVKYSEWPPSYWIHTKCRVGSTLSVRIGGDFFLDTQCVKYSDKTVLFIAGGVGINPLASMIFQLEDFKQEFAYDKPRTILLYSAKSESELIFRENLEKIAEKDGNFKLRFFVTGQGNFESYTKNNSSTGTRIKEVDIVQALQNNGTQMCTENILAYVCGPPPFITEMEGILRKLGISKILYETWWS